MLYLLYDVCGGVVWCDLMCVLCGVLWCMCMCVVVCCDVVVSAMHCVCGVLLCGVVVWCVGM